MPTFLWLVVISMESTSVFTGETTSNWLIRILSHFGEVTYREIIYTNYFLRKVGHFVGYAVLSWFAFRGWMEVLAYQTESALRRKGRPADVPKRWHLRAAVLAVLSTLVVAALDEFHQSTVPGRSGVFQDVILDMMGGIFAQFVLLLFWTRKQKRDRPRVSRAHAAVVVPEKAN